MLPSSQRAKGFTHSGCATFLRWFKIGVPDNQQLLGILTEVNRECIKPVCVSCSVTIYTNNLITIFIDQSIRSLLLLIIPYLLPVPMRP